MQGLDTLLMGAALLMAAIWALSDLWQLRRASRKPAESRGHEPRR